MASISNDSGGRRRIMFVAPDESRKSIRLGKCDRKTAEGVKRHVEALLASKIAGESVQRETAVWLKGIGPKLRRKLAAVGLAEAPSEAILGEFVRNYISSRSDVKPGTLEAWRQALRTMVEFFGDDRLLRNLTPGHADEYKSWLSTQKLAPTTIAKRLSFARGFLQVARKHKLIEENPFAELRIRGGNVGARQRFIDRETVQRLMDVANPTWRTIIALCRFGGLRCPSEVLSLEWRHVDWANERLTVPSPKTDRYDGKGSRVVPLFAELRPFLQEASELAERGNTHVIGSNYLNAAQGPNGWRNCNLRTTFQKLVLRAGLKPWPRLFHNLRSSMETELLEKAPIQAVAQWMGHGTQVMLRHYAQTIEEHFDRVTKGGANSGARTARNRAQRSPAASGGELKTSSEEETASDLAPVDANQRETKLLQSIEVLGFEPLRETGGTSEILEGGGAKSGAISREDPDLAFVTKSWPRLTEMTRSAVVALVRNGDQS